MRIVRDDRENKVSFMFIIVLIVRAPMCVHGFLINRLIVIPGCNYIGCPENRGGKNQMEIVETNLNDNRWTCFIFISISLNTGTFDSVWAGDVALM